MKIIINKDWEQLTEKQKAKVKALACNDWSEIEVSLLDYDNRVRFSTRCSYKSIKVTYVRNGKKYSSTISAQVTGREL